jgi:uncharacterized DUF497 family protein
MQFEWDNNKNQANISKHAISFDTAKLVFADNNKIISHNRTVDNEERLQVVGKIAEILIVMVVFTPRNGAIRIISARKASKKERAIYENQ